MTIDTGKSKYIPGIYAKKRPNVEQQAGLYFRKWEKTQMENKAKTIESEEIAPTICFSRKIGIGVLEVAEKVAEKIGYRVADRLIIEQITADSEMSQKTLGIFDERYPGRVREFARLLFGEKSFILSDYMRKLLSAVFALAGSEPTIFVGRGAHLILPRDRVLAIRCISSKEFRIKRVADILNDTEASAEKHLDQADSEQRDFFKRAFGKKDAPPNEFDLILNCDYISDPDWAAEIVLKAFSEKFR
ncbi:MAG: cytidylate kinase-like family protein [Desulfobacterales bacterium]|nr:cytidylate kinase-like family protein [Desulfobacterales bacterium]